MADGKHNIQSWPLPPGSKLRAVPCVYDLAPGRRPISSEAENDLLQLLRHSSAATVAKLAKHNRVFSSAPLV